VFFCHDQIANDFFHLVIRAECAMPGKFAEYWAVEKRGASLIVPLHKAKDFGTSGVRHSPTTLFTRSAAFLAPGFFSRLARWKSIVRGLMPSVRAASLLEAPV